MRRRREGTAQSVRRPPFALVGARDIIEVSLLIDQRNILPLTAGNPIYPSFQNIYGRTVQTTQAGGEGGDIYAR